jgi:hypothetical protein
MDTEATANESVRKTVLLNRYLRDGLDLTREVIEDGKEPQKLLEAVLRWLALPGRPAWLAVYDNVDSEVMLAALHERFLPSGSANGHVIITSRLPRESLPADLTQKRDCQVFDATELGTCDALLLLLGSVMRTVRYRQSVRVLCAILYQA